MTELPRCPQCGIALNIPAEFAGRAIRCLECQTDLVPTDGRYTIAPVRKPKYPARLFLPLAALLLLGSMGVFVNSYYAWQFRQSDEAIVQYTESTIAQMNAMNVVTERAKKKDEKAVAKADELTDEERRTQIQKYAAKHRDELTRTMIIFAAVSLLELGGGLSFALGRWPWLAGLGCLAAIGNLNHGCCFPGAFAGIWGLFTILSNEGQAHFQRK